MSCHYQPLIVPSQHFSIYSDSSVPSGRYAWLTKQVRQLDVFLSHYLWFVKFLLVGLFMKLKLVPGFQINFLCIDPNPVDHLKDLRGSIQIIWESHLP